MDLYENSRENAHKLYETLRIFALVSGFVLSHDYTS